MQHTVDWPTATFLRHVYVDGQAQMGLHVLCSVHNSVDWIMQDAAARESKSQLHLADRFASMLSAVSNRAQGLPIWSISSTISGDSGGSWLKRSCAAELLSGQIGNQFLRHGVTRDEMGCVLRKQASGLYLSSAAAFSAASA